MNFDISRLLQEWSFQPGQIMVRKFKGLDGLDKIQLRLDLGLLQMNAEGRPDGKRPHGHVSLLDYYQTQLRRQAHASADPLRGLVLQAEECAQLQLEAMQYHHRSLCLFQLEDFSGVVRDAEQNLGILDFVSEHAATPEMVWPLQQFRPQILMMRARAKSALALQAGHYEAAIGLIEAGLEDIRSFYREQSRLDLLERCDEIQVLESALNEIRAKRPLSQRERLEKALGEAVRREDYEKAAFYRDALRNLKTQ